MSLYSLSITPSVKAHGYKAVIEFKGVARGGSGGSDEPPFLYNYHYIAASFIRDSILTSANSACVLT